MVITSPPDSKPDQLRQCPNCTHYNKFDTVTLLTGSKLKNKKVTTLLAIIIRLMIGCYHGLLMAVIGMAVVACVYAGPHLYQQLVYGSSPDGKGGSGATMLTGDEYFIPFVFGAAICFAFFKRWKYFSQNFRENSTGVFPFKQLYGLIKLENKFLRCKNCGGMYDESHVVDFFPFLHDLKQAGCGTFGSAPLYLDTFENYRFYQQNKSSFGKTMVRVKRKIEKGTASYAYVTSIADDKDLIAAIRERFVLPPFVFATELLWLMMYEFAPESSRAFITCSRAPYYSHLSDFLTEAQPLIQHEGDVEDLFNKKNTIHDRIREA